MNRFSALSGRIRGWRYWPRTPASLAITVAVAVNLLLAGAYLWSRDGETIHLHIEARGDDFSATVNGQQVVSDSFDAAESGGVMLRMIDTGAVPSFPKPRGVDSIKVTDLDSGTVLLEDDFSKPLQDDATWKVQGDPKQSDGVVGAGVKGALLSSFSHDWRNYAVDVTYRNITEASIRVRAADEINGVDFSFRPYRHRDGSMSLFVDGKVIETSSGLPIELPRSELIRSMVGVVVKPYPKVLLFLLCGLALVTALQFAPRWLWEDAPAAVLHPLAAWMVAGALAVTAFAVTLFLGYVYGDHMPHVPDSVSYVFQANVLASGHFSAPAPPGVLSFNFFFPSLIEVHHGRWTSVYPFGHPLVLAIGARLGAIWLVPPLVGAACVVLMFVVGRKVYGAGTGLLAALLFAGSPFFMMSAADFMSHNTAAMYLLASVAFLVFHDRRPALFPFLSGIFFGLLFNTRPLTAAGLAAPYGVMLLSFVAPEGRRMAGLKQVGAFAAGGLLMLLAYYLYTWGATGSPFTISSTQANNDTVGFAGTHSVTAGISNEQTQLTMIALVLDGWPLYLGLALVLLPFALGSTYRWDWFFLACAIFVMGVYTWYYSTGIMHGPRYWYETTPMLLLLTARGAERAAGFLATVATRIAERVPRLQANGASSIAVLVTYGFVVVLVVWGAYGWLRGGEGLWRVDAMPANAQELKSFNAVDDGFASVADDANLHNALVFMRGCPNWQCYGGVFWTNAPALDSNIVYARDIPDEQRAVLEAFPDRQVYFGDWLAKTLVPFGSEAVVAQPTIAPPEPSGSVTPLATSTIGPTATVAGTPPATATAPRAGDILTSVPETTPTPVPTPTVDAAAALRRDARRLEDLRRIGDALETYRDKHGAYPVVGIATLCAYQFDIGCSIQEVLDPIPRDPLTNQSYWYSSDGQSFIIYAQLEETPSASGCGTIPPHLAGVPNLYCFSGP